MTDLIRILIVEDLPTDAELAEREVRHVLPNSEFLRVETKEDFLSALESFRPDFILSDYKLPHFDGMAALQLAKERVPEVPFILITGSMNEETAVECMKAGAWDYIIKEHIKRLGSAIVNALEQKHIRQEQRQLESALNKSQSMLIETEKIGKVGGWEFNIDTMKQTWTEEVYRIHEVELTYDPNVERGINFYAPTSRPIITEAVRRAIEYGESFDLELEIITAKGNFRNVRAIGQADLEHRRVFGFFQDVTDSRHLEQSIREAAQHWQTTFDAVNDAIMLLDTSGSILRCNKAFASLVKLPFHEIVGSTCWKLMHGMEHPLSECPVEKMKISRKRESLVLPIGDLWYRVIADPIIDEQGAVTGAIHSMTDITEETYREQELLISQKRIKALLDLSLMGESTEEELCNFALEAMVELTGSEGGYLHLFDDESKAILLTSWSKKVLEACMDSKGLHYPLDKAGIWADPARTKQPVIHNDYQSELNKKGCPEGHFPVLRHMSVPVLDGDKVVAIAGVGNSKQPYSQTDIDQLSLFMNSLWKLIRQKRVQTSLELNENKFRELSQEFHALLDANPDRLMLLSPDLNILWTNRKVEDIAKLKSSALVGSHCYRILYEASEPCERCPVLRCFRTGSIETEVLTASDGTIMDIRAVPIKDDNGRVVNVIDMARDITEHRKLEMQLQQAQKMEAMGTLAGGIAHDFNNILNVIMGYSGMLAYKGELNNEGQAYLKEIMDSVDRAAHLTRGILAFSRKQTLEVKPLDVKTVISSVAKMLGRILGEDIRIELRLAEGALPIMADFMQIEQILMNLATNARDAMQKGGVFYIECSQETIGQEFIDRNGFGKEGEYVVVTITDTGHGMPEHVRLKIFDPFFTTKEIGRGTGLGMSIVFGIIKQHKGYIICESEPERGTTFRLYFPLLTNADSCEGDNKAESRCLATGKGTVLLVEDDANLLRLMRIILMHGGYTVLTAENGNEALRVFEEHRGVIDIAVMDMLMPGRNGLETRDELWKIRPGLPCIFVSGYSTPALVERDITPGEIILLEKPVAPNLLLKTVKEQIEAAREKDEK